MTNHANLFLEKILQQIDKLSVEKSPYFFSVSKEKNQQLAHYAQLLYEENLKFNLLGTKDIETIITKHIFDSLLGINFFPQHKKAIADLGSGGGLPAIPLAIYLPKNDFYLIESKEKKTSFLEKVTNKIELQNIQIVSQNIGEVKKQFNFFTARAFSSLKKIIHLTQKIASKPTTYLLYKGKKVTIAEELKLISKSIHYEIIPLKHSLFVGERNLVKLTLK